MAARSTDTTRQALKRELSAIEKAYGKKVDLYRDVLKISPQASAPEIQKAFFHRRQELFGVLGTDSSTKKARAEKQMDALVLTYRIVGDAVMRQEYNALRQGKKRRQAPRTVTPEKQDRREQRQDRVYVMRDDGQYESKESPPPRQSSSKRSGSSKRKLSRSDVASLESSYVSSDIEDTTVHTIFSSETMLSNETEYTLTRRGKKSFLAKATEEIEGCIEDTLNAFDQVFHVFTLEEKDIRAVTTKIQKAKKDLVL